MVMKKICMLKKRYLVGDFDGIKEAKGKDKLKAMRRNYNAIGKMGH